MRIIRFLLLLAGLLALAWLFRDLFLPGPETLPTSVPGLIGQLKNANPWKRRLAAQALGKKGPQAAPAVGALVELLGDDEGVRDAAARALARIGAPAAEPLADVLRAKREFQDPRPSAALEALLGMRPAPKKVLPALLPLLRDKSPETMYERKQVLRLLGRIGPDAREALPLLIEAARDPSLAPEAVAAVQAIDPEAEERLARAAAPVLIEALRKRRADVYDAADALALLGRRARAAIPALRDAVDWAPDDLAKAGNRITLRGALHAFARMGAEGEAVVCDWVASPKTEQEIRLEALAYLLVEQPPTPALLTALGKALRDKDPLVRTRAADVLGYYGADARGAIPALVEALADKDLAEGNLGQPEGGFGDNHPVFAPGNAEGVRAPPNPLSGDKVGLDQPGAAALALARMGRHAVPALTEALGSDNPLVRRQAAQALAHELRPPAAALPSLRKALADRDRDVALEAAGALLAHGDDPKEPVRVIERGLGDPRTAVQTRALSVLQRAGPVARGALPALYRFISDGPADLRHRAISALAPFKEDAAESVRVLARRLKATEDEYERQTIAWRLGDLAGHSEDAVKILLDLFQSEKDTDIHGAVSALLDGHAGKNARRVIPALIAVAKQEGKIERARMAVQALGDLGPAGGDAVPFLIGLVRDPNDLRFMEALTALGKIGPPARAAVPALRRVIREPNATPAQFLWASFALARITEEARTFGPLVLASYHDRGGPLRSSMRLPTLEALTLLGPLAAPAVPELIETATDAREDLQERLMALEVLGAIGPGAAEAVPALAGLLDGKAASPRETRIFPLYAARVLKAIGPAGKAALPRLRELAQSEHDETALAAREAVEAIERK